MKRMSLLILAVLVTAFSFRATAVSVQENVITLTSDEVEKCVEDGGCFVVSRKAMAEFVEEQKRHALIDCRNAT